jgi:hypothetical protein
MSVYNIRQLQRVTKGVLGGCFEVRSRGVTLGYFVPIDKIEPVRIKDDKGEEKTGMFWENK